MKSKKTIIFRVLIAATMFSCLGVTMLKIDENQLLNDELKKSNKEVNNLEKENNKLNDEITNLLQQNKELNDKLESLQNDIDNLTKQNSTTEQASHSKSHVIQTKETENVLNVSWSGQVLTPQAGTIIGPSGKETYYNLPMDGVVSIMRSIGNNDPYWVRADGVKMLGDYVMIAADLNIRPRGSLVETSLGSFAASNPTQIDIAVSW